MIPKWKTSPEQLADLALTDPEKAADELRSRWEWLGEEYLQMGFEYSSYDDAALAAADFALACLTVLGAQNSKASREAARKLQELRDAIGGPGETA